VYGSRSAPQILRNQCRSNARDGIYFGDGAEGTAQGNVCEKTQKTVSRYRGKALIHW